MSWEAALARNSELTGADEGFWLSHQVGPLKQRNLVADSVVEP
jgi:hypothetical protein